MVGYDPVRQDIMEKTYAHDPAVGDPVVTYGMDPFLIRAMTDPFMSEDNMGAYFPNEDAIEIAPGMSPRETSDTAKHEFRHRGAEMLDQYDGLPPDRGAMNELLMRLNDIQQGIGDDRINMPQIIGLLELLRASTGDNIYDILSDADHAAAAYNERAISLLGGGAPYASQYDRITNILENPPRWLLPQPK